MAETLDDAVKRRFHDDTMAEIKLNKVRERIRRNFPDIRAPLQWRRASATLMVSLCNRFAIEKVGEGEAARYNAKLLPNSVLGHRRYTLDLAKDDCNRHASPLPLEPPPQLPLIDREPGSDDE